MIPNVLSSFDNEAVYWQDGFTNVVGVDEVGRGCFAGPVVAGAVIFVPEHSLHSAITDSKQLSAKKRELLSRYIKESAKCWAIGAASVEEINTIGILPATFLAMERAIRQMPSFEVTLIDGSVKPKFKKIQPDCIQTIIRGDSVSYTIAAASIIAKVYRDKLMKKLHLTAPEYAWDQNKGYGTAAHREAIQQCGITKHHRLLFCRNVLAGLEQ